MGGKSEQAAAKSKQKQRSKILREFDDDSVSLQITVFWRCAISQNISHCYVAARARACLPILRACNHTLILDGKIGVKDDLTVHKMCAKSPFLATAAGGTSISFYLLPANSINVCICFLCL
jgi:hypothetical protein